MIDVTSAKKKGKLKSIIGKPSMRVLMTETNYVTILSNTKNDLSLKNI